MRFHIEPRPAIDWEDRQATFTLAAAASLADSLMQEILAFRPKPGKEFRITGFGQAWDAPVDGNMVYSLWINGNPHPKYHRLDIQIAPPETLGVYELPTPIIVPQSALIQVMSVSTVAGDFFARLKGEYFDP